MKKITVVQDKNIIVIGEITKNLPIVKEDTVINRISSYVFCSYKGIRMYEYSTHDNKKVAIDIARDYHKNSKVFIDGTIPFCIVLYVRGKGWMIYTSNTSENANIVNENLKSS